MPRQPAQSRECNKRYTIWELGLFYFWLRLIQLVVIVIYFIFTILDNLAATATGLDKLPVWFLRLGAPVFTRTWLRYVRVFAVAIPSVCLSSVVCLSVTLVHPTHGVEPFGKIYSPPCTLAILWPPCKILRRSSQGNPSVGGVKRKRGIKLERFRTYRRLYLTNGTR